jgi:aldehyde dehydrogenase (NAD(P)+)
MSASARSARPTGHSELDRAIDDVKLRQTEFARLPVREKLELVRACMPRLWEVARGWVEAGCLAKGLRPGQPESGEEWLVGPTITMRNLRLLAESLEAVATRGRPPLGKSVRVGRDGRLEISLFPASAFDTALFTGFTARVRMQRGTTETSARGAQASFYQRRDAAGGVTAILGAGNVSSIPPTDALYKMFVDGNVCVLKMNPVNEWVGPLLERALSPLCDRGYLRVVYGGGEEGAYLCQHPGIDDIHITGSDRTHDLIVWGPPGAERERRKRENDPILKKTITSELGNVSPVLIVPGPYSDEELWFQAKNVASMVVNNGSFNCNAGKVLVLSRGWQRRERFLGMVKRALSECPPRKAYYPGAFDRYQELVGQRPGVERFGHAAEDQLPWALVTDLDPADRAEKLFQVEPFCGILSETALPAGDAVEFLAAAARFANDRLWGTLNACIVIHPRDEKDPAVGAALDQAIDTLRYGTVGINHWPALGFALISPPWGGHPSATLADVQSGLGFVHNTFMIEGIEKCVVRGPLVARPKPAWFYDNHKTHRIGEKLVSFEASPSWLRVPGLAAAAFTG